MRDGVASGRWRVGLAASVAMACLAGAGPASAHLRSGTVAVDYRASVSHPVSSAYSAQIYQSDHGLSVTLRPGHVVLVLGYLGEPVIRLDETGLSINAASPTARAMHLVDRAQAVDAPAPRWRLQRDRHSVVWHDARVQGLPPGLAEGVWRVPLLIDGRKAVLSGELHRFADPPAVAVAGGARVLAGHRGAPAGEAPPGRRPSVGDHPRAHRRAARPRWSRWRSRWTHMPPRGPGSWAST